METNRGEGSGLEPTDLNLGLEIAEKDRVDKESSKGGGGQLSGQKGNMQPKINQVKLFTLMAI